MSAFLTVGLEPAVSLFQDNPSEMMFCSVVWNADRPVNLALTAAI